MKYISLILLLAASTMAGSAQTPAKPAAKPATATAKSATTATKSATTATKSAASADKLPPGIPPVKALKKTLFTVALRYQDIKIGTGAVAEPNKLYKVLYTGWVASDGHKFDSTDDHPRQPLKDKDGKPVLGADGKPEQGPPQPISFPQGFGRVIPGWDQGFDGMKIGGKRRIFIPWRLAYGEKGRPGPDAAHPGIPAKADLIFDVELVDVSEMPTQPQRPGMNGARPMGGHPSLPGAPGAPAAPAATSGSAPGPGPSHGMGAPAGTAPAVTATPATPAATPAPAAPAATAAPAAPTTK
jgi:peptidylprolyl isomerase